MSGLLTFTMIFALAVSLAGFFYHLVQFNQGSDLGWILDQAVSNHHRKWGRRYFVAVLFFTGAIATWMLQ